MKTFKTKLGTELPLMDIRGKDYLQVMHRLVWFREEHPDWTIETSIQPTNKECIAEAKILNESGRLIAIAHKLETLSGFPDFIEKAETGAIGRALALCGFGTQFTDDLDEKARIVDAPTPPKPNVAAVPKPTTAPIQPTITRRPSKQAEHDASGEDFM